MNFKQIYSINASMAAYVVGDVLVKSLGQFYPAVEVIFWRSFVIACGFGLVLAIKGKLFSKHFLSWALLARCAFDCVNAFSFVLALVHIDIAEIYAILLTAPFLMTILAIIFLKEPVGWRRWLAIIGGFGGSLLIIKPSAQGFNYWAAVGLVAALTAALRDFVTTKIHPETSAFEVTLSSALFTAAAGFLVGIGQVWKPVAAYDAFFLVALAAASLIGTVLLVYACRIGPLFIAASFRFMLLVWGGFAGYFVFGNVPDLSSLLGAAIIVICALYIFYREAVRQRAIASALPAGGGVT
ncbi:MAG TPA: DMT family transporter [Pseudolabrys sp.]|nr:DMT family transporter [Pseudolabrys sp.]